jgi:hypothetical protein
MSYIDAFDPMQIAYRRSPTATSPNPLKPERHR